MAWHTLTNPSLPIMFPFTFTMHRYRCGAASARARALAPAGPSLLHWLLSTSEERFRSMRVWLVRRALKRGRALRAESLVDERFREIKWGSGEQRAGDKA